jgi:SAM-dependent methyltransferase
MSRYLDACPLCNGTQFGQLYSARDPHYGIPGFHRIVRCRECELVFLNPMYSDRELASFYPSDYYAYNTELKENRWKKLAKKLLGYWQGTKEPIFTQPGAFLDVGCGSGSFVERMRNAGWRSYGVDVNEEAVKTAQSRGLQVFRGPLQSIGFESDCFDYIRASHSLEHVSCPHELLAEIRRILKPAGQLLIAIPNIDSASARLFHQHWYHLCPPVHTFNYSVKTIRSLLELHGFRIENLVFNSQYVGVLGSLQIWINRDSGKISSQGFFFESRLLRVITGWLEHLLDAIHQGDMIEVTATKVMDQVSAPIN